MPYICYMGDMGMCSWMGPVFTFEVCDGVPVWTLKALYTTAKIDMGPSKNGLDPIISVENSSVCRAIGTYEALPG